MASCLITKLFQPKHSTIKQLTRGRKVGFTGTIAVLDGRTRTGQYPNMVPARHNAALAPSAHRQEQNLSAKAPKIHYMVCSNQKSLSQCAPNEFSYLYIHTFISKFNKGKAKNRIWISTHTAIHHLQQSNMTPTQKQLPDPRLHIYRTRELPTCNRQIVGFLPHHNQKSLLNTLCTQVCKRNLSVLHIYELPLPPLIQQIQE